MGLADLSIQAQDGLARSGQMITRRGTVPTPAFMPVGTAGTVKGMLPGEVKELGASIILANTYHLMVRPGIGTVAKLGGLHRFMDWGGPILTDSGGFQVFSLAGLRKVDEQGVSFQSHLDGSPMSLTPETAIQAQQDLGSDIMMMLDECPPAGADRGYLTKALERDARWAARAQKARTPEGGALFGIVQGGVHRGLRAQSAQMIQELELDGHALGGLSVGEPKDQMMEVLAATVPLLDPAKPIYLMGVGEPEDLVACVGLGVDMFDCVLPTRMARNGTLLTAGGRMNIRNARYAQDERPVEPDCECLACRRFSRSYLRHLFMTRELLAYRLNTIHNLHYTLNLMAGLRRAIKNSEYNSFAHGFKARLAEGIAD